MVGYRHFDTNQIEPDYEFGFGLSYSEFRFRDLVLGEDELTFTIENVSGTDGEEVAQVYVEYPWDSWNSHPLRELRAFKKVFVPARSCVEVTIPFTEELFAYYNSALQKWTVEEGIYQIHVGNSSRNLPLCAGKNVKQNENLSNWQVMK